MDKNNLTFLQVKFHWPHIKLTSTSELQSIIQMMLVCVGNLVLVIFQYTREQRVQHLWEALGPQGINLTGLGTVLHQGHVLAMQSQFAQWSYNCCE